MIDWHSHILPGMDDGSKDVQESLALLQMLSQQDVQTVVATPHFYANQESAARFLERRAAAYALLRRALPPDAPDIRLGAEVRYYPGISRLPELRQLCVEGSEVLLLEMPFSRWTEYTVRELVELAGRSRLVPVLAHVERYWSLQTGETWQRLVTSGILMQVNANCLLRFSTKRKALSMLRRGQIHLIGSDCHNLTSRPPKIGDAGRYICKKLGREFPVRMNELGKTLLP